MDTEPIKDLNDLASRVADDCDCNVTEAKQVLARAFDYMAAAPAGVMLELLRRGASHAEERQE
jgi:hypothetical protein